MKLNKIALAALLIMSCIMMSSCSNQRSSTSGSNARFQTIDEVEIPTAKSDVAVPEVEEKKTLYPELYKMDLELDVEKHIISGTVNVKLNNETDEAIGEVYVRNYPATILAEKEKKSELTDFRLDELGKRHLGEPLSYSAKEDASVVVASLGDKIISPGETAEISFDFTTEIPKKKDRFGYTEADGLEVYNLSFCFPHIAMYENGVWNENPYVDIGESNYQRVSDYKVNIKVPKGYEVAGVGQETRDGDKVKIKASKVREMAMVISDDLKRETEEVDGVKLNYYYFDVKGTKEYNRLSKLAMRDSMQLFTKYFGKYPYKELDVVQTYFDSAMEYSGLVMIGLPDVKTITEIDDIGNIGPVSVIAHEIAHQWFYGLVGNDPYKDPWLDEAFAAYCEEILYPRSAMESVMLGAEKGGSMIYALMGEEEFRQDMEMRCEQGVCGKESSKGINKPCDFYDEEEFEYSIYVYDGGYTFLYELSQAMGEGVFFDMMKNYVKTYSFREVTPQEFLDFVKLYDDGDKVNEVISKYVK